jgi:hypothetical protein
MILTYHIPLPKTQTHTKRKTIPCEHFPSAHICQLPTYNVMEEDLDICCNAVCWSTVKILGPRNHPGSKMGKWVLRGKDVLTLSVPERCEGGLVLGEDRDGGCGHGTNTPSVEVSLSETPHPHCSDELAVALCGRERCRCVNVCMNGWMLGSIEKRFEWPLVRKAQFKCSPFTFHCI